MTERARVVQTAKGYSFFFLGISCVAFGVAVTASSQLGTSPISSVAYVAHRVSVVGELRPVWSLGATSFV
ncbi:MAG: hypothetical protein II655_05290, partial [Thermoguttaceae bacterium]|nr:hypothetical protein [Thermoguttaceae bacterium]